MKPQLLNNQVDIEAAKKKRRRKKKARPKKRIQSAETPQETKKLDGFLLLHSCYVKYPHEAIDSKLRGENIIDVEEEDLHFFQNLTNLDLTENVIELHKLINLKSLRTLSLQYNQLRTLEVPPNSFMKLETLNLSFNNIPSERINELSKLPCLRVLDLSGNELQTLPGDMSGFKQLTEFNLSSNTFSSESLAYNPAEIFLALSSIAKLNKLNLARNMFQGIHAEMLSEDAFSVLQELDFSFNNILKEEGLSYAQYISHLQILIVTGNPFALTGQYKDLEQSLNNSNCAIIINKPPNPPAYLKKAVVKKEHLPYPKPIALVQHDTIKNLKKSMYEADLNKGIALALTEISSNKETEEIFPKPRENSDIYTPEDQKRKVFLTENNNIGDADDQQEVQSQSSEYKEPPKAIQDDVGEISAEEYAREKLKRFYEDCKEVLGDVKEYDAPISISCASKKLRHALKYPKVCVQKQAFAHYMSATVSSKIMQNIKYDERKKIEAGIIVIQSKMTSSSLLLRLERHLMKMK
jgi:Leucine-rich repeat (LRR) protein